MSSYHLEGPDHAIEDLPHILPTAERRDGDFEVANTDAWFRIARDCRLVGKPLDAAIAAYGDDYLISQASGAQHPCAYYMLAGTHS